MDEVLKTICMEIEDRYEMVFLKIGTDKDHVHFLVQSILPSGRLRQGTSDMKGRANPAVPVNMTILSRGDT